MILELIFVCRNILRKKLVVWWFLDAKGINKHFDMSLIIDQVENGVHTLDTPPVAHNQRQAIPNLIVWIFLWLWTDQGQKLVKGFSWKKVSFGAAHRCIATFCQVSITNMNVVVKY